MKIIGEREYRMILTRYDRDLAIQSYSQDYPHYPYPAEMVLFIEQYEDDILVNYPTEIEIKVIYKLQNK